MIELTITLVLLASYVVYRIGTRQRTILEIQQRRQTQLQLQRLKDRK